MRSSFLYIFLFLFNSYFTPLKANSYLPLGSKAKISIITTSPGEDLYTVFGHAAIRVKDSSQNLDLVFGYGEFDFSTPNFYPEFVRGTLLYTISLDPFEGFKSEFLNGPYQMKEQDLDLDSLSKNKILNLLLENYKPQNRLYHYDFFFDNCSSRVRDIINKGVSPGDFFSKTVPPNAPSFRDLLKTYLINRPWIRLGTDLILGMPADKKLSPYEQTFLPFFLSQYLDLSKYPSNKPLVSGSRFLLKNPQANNAPEILSPIGFIWLIFLLSLLSLNHTSLQRAFSFLVYFLYTLLGILILYLWLGTERTSYGLNFNILWASPLLAVILWTKGSLKTYFSLGYLASLALLLLVLAFKIQVFNPAVLPLAFIPLPHCYLRIRHLFPLLDQNKGVN